MDILSDEIFDALCSICKNKGKNTEGKKFCVDCHDYFCVNCVNIHSQVPLCAGHMLLDSPQVKSESSKGLPRASEERCDRHNYKRIDMYCQNHDNVGCSTCMATDHRSCKDIFYIPEFVQNNNFHVATTDIQTKLKAIVKTLAEQANQFKKDKQRLLRRKSQLLADIMKFRQEINDQLDKLEKSSIEEIDSKVKCLEDKIEDDLKQLQALKKRVTSASDGLASPNTAEVFVYMKMGEDAANAANKYIEDDKIKSTMDDIKFQPDSRILTQLGQKKFLGTLTMKPKKNTVSSLLQIKGKQSHSLKGDELNISMACYIEDGTIIVACKSNTIRRFNRYNYTLIDSCDLPDFGLNQMCSINETQVAVTFPFHNLVIFISLQRKMKIIHDISTDFICHGLAYSNNYLYISDHGTSVYMYTLSGRKLAQLSMNHLGHNLCSKIYSLAVSKDGTRIYVADYHNGLIVLDNNGQIVSIFNGEQLQGANCCYLTEAGSVLVSGTYSNNVLQFTCDGELTGEIIKPESDKGGISSVCYNQQMSKICITRFGEEKFEVYDI